PLWDETLAAISHNDIEPRIIASGIVICRAPMQSVVANLFDAAAYEGRTLWSDIHNEIKIARVIDAWTRGVTLSPPFFVELEAADFEAVGDGRHRLTVARAVGAAELPFMVPATSADWVMSAVQGVVRVL